MSLKALKLVWLQFCLRYFYNYLIIIKKISPVGTTLNKIETIQQEILFKKEGRYQKMLF